MKNLEAKQEAIRNITFEDVCNAIVNGNMPKVDFNGSIGKVTVIKNNVKHKGIGVDFGKGYDDFFHADKSTDKRSKYIYELKLIDEIAKLYVNQINSCENCGIRTSKYCEKCYDDASDSLPY